MDYKEQDSFRKLFLTWRRKDFLLQRCALTTSFTFITKILRVQHVQTINDKAVF